jgi:aspartate carbamoyltransferase catalytic subunit
LPILIEGARRFPLGPIADARIPSLFSGFISRYFFPFATCTSEAFSRSSHAASDDIFTFAASTVSSISKPERSAWAFWQVFQPFLRYAQSIFFISVFFISSSLSKT